MKNLSPAFVLFLLASLESALSFGILVPQQQSSRRVAVTALRYTVIGPPPDDDDNDAEPFIPRQRQRQREALVADGGLPRDYSSDDFHFAEGYDDLNVDAFDSMAGGIVPGHRLSALCGDD